MIAPSRRTHCSSARSGSGARSVRWPASSVAWPKRRGRASAACSCRLGPVARPATSRSSGWRESVSSPAASQPDVGVVVVALPPGYVERPPDWLGKLRGDRLGFVPGGAQRVDSVRSGLRVLPDDATIILIHDAARPFVSRGTIDAVIARARAGVGAVAAVPTSD